MRRAQVVRLETEGLAAVRDPRSDEDLMLALIV